MSAPRWFKKYENKEDCLSKAAYNLEAFEFIEELEDKVINGFYSINEIAFDPTNDIDNYDWTSDYLDEPVVKEIPTIMFQKLEGKIVDWPENYDEGLPVKYAQKIYDILDQYEVK